MTIDMAEFHQIFFEESFEGLEIMESSLLGLDAAGADRETIDTIFRAAHSIKGGSGTFGFNAIADFTHLLETLLDEMRAGVRDVTPGAVDLLLHSVDAVRALLEAARAGEEPDATRTSDQERRLREMLSQPDPPASAAAQPCTGSAPGAGYRIRFRPHAHMLRSGNDVLPMVRELAELGELAVSADVASLPTLAALDPESSYLAWELELRGPGAREPISEVFDWVEGDCDLEIAPLADEPAPATGRAPASEHEPARRPAAPSDGGSIRVDTGKIDALVNLVGELVITQAMLARCTDASEAVDAEALRDGLSQLERNTRELQEGVMRIRMLPIGFAFNRFPRLVHDLTARLGKRVELEVLGEQTELDKTVLEKVGDPLVHLVRNALDHGIETPEARVAAGKAPTGRLTLEACHAGGNIVIEISDDGAGLARDRILERAIERGLVGADDDLDDDAVYRLVFEPGFSTATAVSDISGRGVGMDVVRRNICDLGGSVAVRSVPGEGSTFTIRLPLTLAIIDGQLVRVGDETYIIPLLSIVESLLPKRSRLGTIAGNTEVYEFRGEHIPVVRLHGLFGTQSRTPCTDGGIIVVAEAHGRQVGLHIDDLLGQQQVVIKSLETNYRPVEGLAGATILGDGTVALILDVPGLVDLARRGAPPVAAVA